MSTTDITIMSITTPTDTAAPNVAELLAHMGHQQTPSVVARAGVCSGFFCKTLAGIEVEPWTMWPCSGRSR